MVVVAAVVAATVPVVDIVAVVVVVVVIGVTVDVTDVGGAVVAFACMQRCYKKRQTLVLVHAKPKQDHFSGTPPPSCAPECVMFSLTEHSSEHSPHMLGM